MNVKDHIEAGHYPVDKYGFPEVPREAGTVSIISTNGPKPEYVLVGMREQRLYGWDADGNPHLGFVETTRLLPPPPRKVPLEGWACVWLVHPVGKATIGWSKENLIRDAGPDPDGTRYRIVPLTGSYEEEWT